MLAKTFRSLSKVKNPLSFSFCTHLENLRQQLIKNSLLYVNKTGWNERSIILACKDMDLSSASSKILENGTYEMIDHLMGEWNKKLGEELTQKVNIEKEFDAFAKEAIKIRLIYQIPYINRWNEAMAIGAYPQNIRTTGQHILNLGNEILFSAKYKGEEAQWHLERLAVIKIFASTELFMLTDKSDNFSETWKFLDRRFEDKSWIDQKLHLGNNILKTTLIGLESITSMLKGFPSSHDFDIDSLKNSANK